MYTIVSNTHRVTKYVISEAYKWLYKEVENNKYTATKQQGARALMLRIRTERKFTEETYEKFFSMMENKPFVYLIRQKNKSCAITTNHIRNYFVKFNEEILPLGFIIDFFEDEYETEEERKKLIDDFIKSESSEEFENHCRTELEKRIEPQIKFKDAHPSVFHTPASFYVTNGIRVLITVIMFAMFMCFVNETKMFDILGDWMFKAKFDFDALVNSSYGVIKAFLLEADATDMLSYGEYFTVFSGHMIFNGVVLLILISRIKYLIRFLIINFKILICRSKLNVQEKYMDYLEESGIDELKDHFTELAPQIRATGQFTDDMLEGLPAAHKKYHSVTSFDFSKVENSIRKMHASKSAYKLRINYDSENSVGAYKKAWRSGLVGTALLAIIIAVIDVPGLYNVVIPELENILANLFG